MAELKDDNELFKNLIKKSKLEIPFADFEDAIMQSIEERKSIQEKISKQLRLSKFFFLVGTLFGIIISILFTQLNEPILNISPKILALIFHIVFATLFFTQLNNYITSKQ